MAEIKASLAKKSNKSRFSRIRKLGALEFRRLTQAAELDRILDDVIDFYDLRQGAVNGATPFRDDPCKRDFHRALFGAAPDETHLTVTFVDDRPIAALWGAISGKTVHLGIIASSPFVAEHSPGKLHLMQLSERMLSEGLDVLDLTPGGDPWKERFANAHDEVAEVLLFSSAASARRAKTVGWLLAGAKRSAVRIGIQPSDVREFVGKIRKARPAALMRKATQWTAAQREFRIYRAERELSARYPLDARIATNSISDLLLFEPGEPWQRRDAFLASALERVERGESVYTIRVDGRLAHFGWLVRDQRRSFMTEVEQSIELPERSVALYDYYTHPDFRARGLYRAAIGHMLRAAFDDAATRYAYICVLADNEPSRHVIEAMGFQYQGSLHWRCRFGRRSKWADPVFTQHVAIDA